MKKLLASATVAAAIFVATPATPVAHADEKPIVCVWPYVGDGRGACVYLPHLPVLG